MEQETISHKCNVCCCDYTDDEGGIQGYFGVLPVSFCPTCFSSMCDMADQFINEPEEETVFDHLKGFDYIVINSCHGGFGLSREATLLYLTKAGIPYSLEEQSDREQQLKLGSKIVVNNCEFSSRTIARNDPILIDVVAELKSNADSSFSQLKIVRVPANVDWLIEEYDGIEWVAEKHRTWE
jgi:hypothetical protein